MSKHWDDREVTTTVKVWISWPKGGVPSLPVLRERLAEQESFIRDILLNTTSGGVIHSSTQNVDMEEDLS